MEQPVTHSSPPVMNKEDFVYSRIGMALVSAQRVEYVTTQLLSYLVEFDKELYGITSMEFLDKAAKSKSGKKTLGAVFSLLKLNPQLVIEEELDDYLQKRNLLAHGFWTTFLHGGSDGKEAVDFCYDFGKQSMKIESFFKGFLYFLALRHVKDRGHLDTQFRDLDNDFEYFIAALKEKQLRDKAQNIL